MQKTQNKLNKNCPKKKTLQIKKHLAKKKHLAQNHKTTRKKKTKPICRKKETIEKILL